MRYIYVYLYICTVLAHPNIVLSLLSQIIRACYCKKKKKKKSKIKKEDIQLVVRLKVMKTY